MLRRLVWNPRWNENLYLTSLAERVLSDGRDHASNEILARIRKDLPDMAEPRYRIVLVSREGQHVVSRIAYVHAGPE